MDIDLTNNQEKKSRTGSRFFWITFGVISLIVIIFLGIYTINFSEKKLQELISTQLEVTNQATNNDIIKRTALLSGNGNFWIGTSSPKLIITQFSDFSCPFCKESYGALREASIRYADQIKIVFRSYPVHEDSINKALAAYCTGEQGLFWQMHDKLFQNQNETIDLTQLAKQIGADLDEYASCFQEERYLSLIKKDYSDAKELEVVGTPTWFFGIDKYAGSIPYDQFFEMIDTYLQE